jgi:hypothetical protein
LVCAEVIAKKTLVTREQLATALQRQHGIGKSAGAVFFAMASLARFAPHPHQMPGDNGPDE